MMPQPSAGTIVSRQNAGGKVSARERDEKISGDGVVTGYVTIKTTAELLQEALFPGTPITQSGMNAAEYPLSRRPTAELVASAQEAPGMGDDAEHEAGPPLLSGVLLSPRVEDAR